jgi:hypothetical protein
MTKWGADYYRCCTVALKIPPVMPGHDRVTIFMGCDIVLIRMLKIRL